MGTNVSSSAQVAWIRGLPGEGGDWGRGVVGTINEVEGKIARLRAEAATLDTQKVKLMISISSSEKLLKATVKRADTEAPMMFADAQIAKAKGAMEDAVAAPGPPLDAS